MSREKWSLIKQSKVFYVQGYRLGISILVGSVLLSTLFALSIYFIYLREPEPDYYATNGVTPLVQLKALSAPNNSSVALLEPDPAEVNQEKAIPQ